MKGRKLIVTSASTAKLTLGETKDDDTSKGDETSKGDKLVVVLDENGEASITLGAWMSGLCPLQFEVEGTNFKSRSLVDVYDDNMTDVVVKAPMASRVSGTSLYRGQTVRLACESEGVTIYYTTDGSCPCDEASRKLYEGPIVVDKDMTIKAIAIGKNQAESEVSEFKFGIRQANLDIRLDKGWNWASHNRNEDMLVTELATSADRIRTEKGEAVNTEMGWRGNISTLAATENIKVQTREAVTHHISGDEYNPTEQLIALHEGWNWIGYPLSQTMTVGEALSMMDAEEGDVICSPDGYAIYEDSEWDGSLTLMTPGKGYLYKSASPKSFIYNNTIVSNAKARYAGALAPAMPWTANKYAYPNVMNVTATIDLGSLNMADNAGLTIAAFCGDECRGVAELKGGVYYLTVYGEKDEDITFRAVSADKKVYDFLNHEPFTADAFGTKANPYLLTQDEEALGILSLTHGSSQTQAVYDLTGRRMSAKAPKGVYITRGQKFVTK